LLETSLPEYSRIIPATILILHLIELSQRFWNNINVLDPSTKSTITISKQVSTISPYQKLPGTGQQCSTASRPNVTPMTQEDCPAFSYHVSGLLEKELALPEPRAGSSIKNTLKSTSKELKMRLTTIEIL